MLMSCSPTALQRKRRAVASFARLAYNDRLFRRASNMASWQRTHTCGELRAEHEGLEVVLDGWIENHRHHGGLLFVDLRDRYGVIQLVFDQERPGALPGILERAKRLGAEDVIGVRGEVSRRDPANVNPKRETGEIVKREGQPLVTYIEDDDPKMLAAIDKARSTIDEFITTLNSPTESQSAFSVKLLIKDGGKDSDRVSAAQSQRQHQERNQDITECIGRTHRAIRGDRLVCQILQKRGGEYHRERDVMSQGGNHPHSLWEDPVTQRRFELQVPSVHQLDGSPGG